MPINNIKLNCSNFFTYFAFHPNDKQLSDKDRKTAKLATILFAFSIIGHAICIFAYKKITATYTTTTDKTDEQGQNRFSRDKSSVSSESQSGRANQIGIKTLSISSADQVKNLSLQADQESVTETESNSNKDVKESEYSDTENQELENIFHPNLSELGSLMPERREGLYYNRAINIITHRDLDIKYHKAYQKFMEEDPQDPFRLELQKHLSEGKSTQLEITITSLDSPKIAVPDGHSIENQARFYFEKYGIVMLLANNGTLFDVIDSLNQKITTPMYLGIISTESNLYCPSSSDAHVTPWLFYFPGNQKKEQIECISMDSVGRGFNYLNDSPLGLNYKNFYVSSSKRQADSYSCHTDALVILRNALLSLRFHRYENGFKEVLQNAEMEEEEIISLPHEWDYTSQIKTVLPTDQMAIRTFFSKKKKGSQTVEEHRKKHTQKVTFKYVIKSIDNKHDIASPPPEGVTYTNNHGEWNISFTARKKINTYLLDKGHDFARKASYNESI